MADPNVERRKQVMVGELPTDFLRLGSVGSSPVQQQIQLDHVTAASLQAQQGGFPFVSSGQARLSITITQAKLTKNYGLTKMDPYCRVRVGHSVFETHTSHSGGKNPRWSKTVQCQLPQGVDSIYVEIFDEKAFTMDDRIAWAHISISQKVMNGETVDEWYHLNGRQGEGKEGMLNLVLSYQPPSQVPMGQPIMYTTPGVQPVMVIPGGMPAYSPPLVGQPMPPGVLPPGAVPPGTLLPGTLPPGALPQQQQQVQGPLYTEEDVAQLRDMFPHVEDDVIKSLLEVNGGNKDSTINNLLSMDL
nr:Toll-interacting protein [Arenicola marina]